MSDDLTVNGQVPRVPEVASAVVAALPGDTGGHLFDQGVFLTDEPPPPPPPTQHVGATIGDTSVHAAVAAPMHAHNPVHNHAQQVQRRTKPVYTQEPDLSDTMPHVRRPTYTSDPIQVSVSAGGTVVNHSTSQQVAVTVSGGVPTVVPTISAAGDVFGTGANALANGQPLQQSHNQFGFGEHPRTQRVGTGAGSSPGSGAPAVSFSFGGEYMPPDTSGVDGQFGANPRFDNELPNVVYDISKDVEKTRPVDTVTVPVVTPSASTGMVTSAGLSSAGTPTSTVMGTGAASGEGGKPPTPVRVNQPGSLPYGGETVDKCVECDQCGSLFGDAGSLKRHYARAHRPTTGKGPVYCSQCSASLKNEQNLRRHIAVCHSGSQENRCDMCSASFSSRGSLRIHQQTVHSIPQNAKGGRGRRGGRAGGVGKPKAEKSYLCDMCTDTFKWKGNLKRHRELRHLQLRPYECPICRASFGTKSNMRVHLITHNNNGATAPAPAGANQIPK